MSEELEIRRQAPVIHLTHDIVKTFICPLATDQEVYFFLQLCKSQNLNPFTKEIYLLKYAANQPAAIVAGKELFMKRANRHPAYQGFESGVIVSAPSKDGPVVKYNKGGVVLPGQTLIGGWCELTRSDRELPYRIEVELSEYQGMKEIWADNKPTGEFEVNKIWKGKAATMIRKVAVMQCHREAFPEELGGLIAEGELPYIDIDLPTYSLSQPAPGHIEPPRQKEKAHTISDPGKPISEGQSKAIHTLLSKLDIKDEDARCNCLALILKKEVAYVKDDPEKPAVLNISMGEASDVIKELDKRVNAPKAPV